MIQATLSEIKKELKYKSKEEVLELCLKLARYKKENKEFLNYLLFEAHDDASYIQKVKDAVLGEFEAMTPRNLHLFKKGIKKILKIVKKYIKYSGNKEIEVELLIYFCENLKTSNPRFNQSPMLANLYQRQIKTIHKALSALHEDLQYDYQQRMEEL